MAEFAHGLCQRGQQADDALRGLGKVDGDAAVVGDLEGLRRGSAEPG
jgi:hypothetical protein